MTALENTLIYHITDVANLNGILDAGGLNCDRSMLSSHPEVIGYEHIKKRRMEEIQVDCCPGRFVGDFVPFYYCPRSPMLYVLNKGNTGKSIGSQQTVIHLVSTVAQVMVAVENWAISDGNAGALHTSFYKDLDVLKSLNWASIRATDWRGKTHQKSAEFLALDHVPWKAFHQIGCMNAATQQRVVEILDASQHCPSVTVEPTWYY